MIKTPERNERGKGCTVSLTLEEKKLPEVSSSYRNEGGAEDEPKVAGC